MKKRFDEELILGAIMLTGENTEVIFKKFSTKNFEKPEHRLIFKAMMELHTNKKPIDMLTVFERLKQKGEHELAGGPFYVAELTNKIDSQEKAKEVLKTLK